MRPPPPGPLADEATRFVEVLLGWVRDQSGGRFVEPPPEVTARLGEAVTDLAVAGITLVRALAEVAATMSPPPADDSTDLAEPDPARSATGPTGVVSSLDSPGPLGATGGSDPASRRRHSDGPRVERIDIG